jgi:hypothetical protein
MTTKTDGGELMFELQARRAKRYTAGRRLEGSGDQHSVMMLRRSAGLSSAAAWRYSNTNRINESQRR